MAILDYTLISLNKNIVYEIESGFYNAEDVVDVIKNVLRCLDNSLRGEYNNER